MTIEEINKYIECFKLNNKIETSEKKPIFLVGAPRSGTTFLYQMITSLFDVEYPTNFIAKFWGNPLFGYILQQELYIKEREDFVSKFKSHHGYSKNSLFEPHEFGYFWGRWFDHSLSHYTNHNENVDKDFVCTVNSLLNFSGKNWLFKNLTLGLKIPLIKKLFPNALFIYVKRNPLLVAQSLYKARIDRFDNDSVWWSLMPKEIKIIKKLSPKEQVVAQEYYISRQIESDLKDYIKNYDYLIVEYESILKKTDAEIEKIGKFLSLTNKNIDIKFDNRSSFIDSGDDFTNYIKKYYGNEK